MRSSASSHVAEYDAVVVGSGINSLACAALLARGGWRVVVLEREEELGGAIRTAELTEPGFRHDVFSAWHPLWVGGPAHAELGAELLQRGLEYLNTAHPTGTLYPDGEAAFLTTATEANDCRRRRAGRARVRRPRHRAVVGGRAQPRPHRLPPFGTARFGCIRRGARPGQPRLAHDDVQLGAGARAARPLGPAHWPRPRRGRFGVHDACDRLRDRGRRHARASGRRSTAGGRARQVDRRPWRRL